MNDQQIKALAEQIVEPVQHKHSGLGHAYYWRGRVFVQLDVPTRLRDIEVARVAAILTEAFPPDAKGATGWQPIETAPKDGTKVLLCSTLWPYSGVDMAYYSVRDGYWTCYGFNERVIRPTHWQPLPAAPVKEPQP